MIEKDQKHEEFLKIFIRAEHNVIEARKEEKKAK